MLSNKSSRSTSDEINLRLLNPFSGAKIELPSMNIKDDRRSLVQNFIISFDLCSSKSFCVVALLGNAKLAFCMHGDNTWTEFRSDNKDEDDDLPCRNILCCNGLLYALSYRCASHKCTLKALDFHSHIPEKVMKIEFIRTL